MDLPTFGRPTIATNAIISIFFIQSTARAGVAVVTVTSGGALAPLLAPEFDFFLLGALDAELFHRRVRLDLRVGEMPVLAEKDVESQAEVNK